MKKYGAYKAREDWETPDELFNQLDGEFHFTLDAAASHKNAKCYKYYTKAMNGLRRPWNGTVYCNPPYGRDIGAWLEKASRESQKQWCEKIVMLLPATTDVIWFHYYVYGKAEIRFIKGRLKFKGAKHSAPFPSMVVIFNGKQPLKN